MDSFFETDSPLWPEDPAYSEVFSGYDGGIRPHHLVHLPPAVICSPRKTGKTTQLRRIFSLQKQFKNVDGIDITIPPLEGGFPEQDLRNLLVRELEATEAGNLMDIISTSRRINQGARESVLAVIDADNLHEDALRWLLYGVRNIREVSRVDVDNRVQVIIDGSFSVDTMTRGPDSEFPMPQLYPREFSETEQKQFVENRLARIGLTISATASTLLWDSTRGDKYLTQKLCKSIVRRSQVQPGLHITPGEVDDSLGFYLKEDRTDELKTALLDCLRWMSEDWAGSDGILRAVIENVTGKWETLPKHVRAAAYRGGLIRRRGLDGVELRAPLVLTLFNCLEGRVRQVKTLIDTYFDKAGVPEYLVPSAKSLCDEILTHAYDNSLKTLHVGYGRKVTDSEIALTAVALDHGQYEGTLEVRTDHCVKPGAELWCFLWKWEDVQGGLDSKLRTLPVKHNAER